MTVEVEEKQGCLSLIQRLFGIQPSAHHANSSRREQPAVYRLRDDFLSPAEFSFYKILAAVAGDEFVVAPKVRLSDIVFVPRANNSYAAQNRINQKHVDFLLCNRKTMRPCVGIELDDSSHQREQRQERDRVVDQVFRSAGLPLERVAVRRAYVLDEVAAQFKPYMNAPAPAARPAPKATVKGEAPVCPKCNVPMVIRTVKTGKYQGTQFYGCVNYPQCRERQPL